MYSIASLIPIRLENSSEILVNEYFFIKNIFSILFARSNNNKNYVIKIELKGKGSLFCEISFYLNCWKEKDCKL